MRIDVKGTDSYSSAGRACALVEIGRGAGCDVVVVVVPVVVLVVPWWCGAFSANRQNFKTSVLLPSCNFSTRQKRFETDCRLESLSSKVRCWWHCSDEW